MPDNFGFAEISTIEDATAVWQSFFGRFFSPEIPPGVDVTFDPTLRVFAPRENKNAKYKHPGFIDPNTKQFPVDPERTLHSDDFDDFLNGNKITIPPHITLNAEGLERVAKAIALGDFEDPALNEEDHTFYALWLFKQNKITRQQMTTILARAQIPKEYPLEKTFPIFAKDGKLTQEAIELLFPAIAKSIYGEPLTREQKERLCYLILAAPKSEQVFFISKNNPKIIAPPNTRIQLGDALLRNGSWHRATYQGEEHDLYLSLGVIEALQIARYGAHGAAANRAKIGKVGIDAVKEAVEYNYRPTAISLNDSGVETHTTDIHGYADTPMPVITEHDVYHAKIQSTLRPDFNLMLNHMHQIISQHTKLKWSKTMWELIDREFLAFVHPTKKMKLKSGEERFIEMLHRKDRDQARLFRSYDPPLFSDDGFAIVWHMVNQSDVWKKLYHVDINRLGYPYGMLIKQIKAFQKTLDGIDKEKKKEVASHHKHTEILTLKYRLFGRTSPTEFKKMCQLIDALQDQLIPEKDTITNNVQKLIFGKYTDGEDKNLTILKFKNFGKEVLIDENSVKEIIPMLIDMQLKFGEKNPEKVRNEVEQIAKQFKSTYLESTFSKKALEASIQTFSTMSEKLDFLEACYEKIIHSKEYTQRHATVDNLFAFFKNPLTTSQRKHIILLKEQLNELMTEYEESNHLNEEKREELRWYIKNRGSNLALCNTDRFYLHLDCTVPSANQDMKH